MENRTRQPGLELYEDDESARMDDGVMSPEDSDLAQLRSLNDGECSADWYNFQESVAHLQLLEEEVLESHKNLVDSMEHWMNQDISLLAMSNEVDYDQDAYAQQLEDMIAEKQEVLSALREKTRAFRECLSEEELRSRTLMSRRN
jgi:kinesin family protein 2/24